MLHNYISVILLSGTTLLSSSMTLAASTTDNSNDALGRLESYEPNTIGIRHDDNDVNYMDFKISLKYPVFHSGKPRKPHYGILPSPYFAFTGRFGQYINSRDSSPVIAKRFNPELFGRYWVNKFTNFKSIEYVDFIYGHESNGQSIKDPAAYQNKRNEFIANNEDPNFANDFISRGWDYLGMTVNFNHSNPLRSLFPNASLIKDNLELTSDLSLRYFLKDGLLQGDQEEYNSWENDPAGKSRQSVDGIRYRVTLMANTYDNYIFKSNKLFLSFTTGYKDIFENNTFGIEWAIEISNIPIMFWYRDGYNSDVSDYFRDVTSYGIGFQFVSK